LSNAYALWFIYLPEYLKACGENKKSAMNYAYQVLIQMQKHNLTHPDEVAFFSPFKRILNDDFSVFHFIFVIRYVLEL